jgi:tripartite-type tricarboxylate transporter receptor subunit TctC
MSGLPLSEQLRLRYSGGNNPTFQRGNVLASIGVSKARLVAGVAMLPVLLTVVVSVVFTLLLSSDVAQSQARTIKIINPYPPGGTADIVARVISEQIGRTQGVTMLIENRPGAGTVIGTEAAARAAPDGNTLLITSVAFVINPHLRNLNYDPLSSFQPICNLTQSPQLLVVNSGSRYRTMADLTNAARAKPSELTLASTGPASPSQIAFEMLKHVANVQMTYVPFPGNAATVNAVLGGHVTAGIANYADLVGHLKAGTLRALATPSPTRIESLPEVPTVAESGHKEFEYEVWFGMFAPARTPNETVSQLSSWFVRAIQVAEVREKLVVQGLYPDGTCGAEFADGLRRQFNDYGRIIREANIRAE